MNGLNEILIGSSNILRIFFKLFYCRNYPPVYIVLKNILILVQSYIQYGFLILVQSYMYIQYGHHKKQ
jgi:hypothetical protein